MADSVYNKNGISIIGDGKTLLNPLIRDLFQQEDVSANYEKDLMEKFGLTYTKPLTLEETFDEMIGVGELDEIEEGEDFPVIDVSKGKGKGFALKIFAGKFKVTKQFVKWAQTSGNLEGADSSVKKEWARLARNIKGVEMAKIKTKNKLFAELLINSRKTNAEYGPGSLTAYGQALVSTAHPYLNGTKAFSNYYGDNALLAGSSAEIAASRTHILNAIKQAKNTIRLQNGDYVEAPTEWELHVPRALADVARLVLNEGSKFSGSGENSNQLNIFAFEGTRVRIVENTTIGSYDKKGNMIGTETMWFIYNKEGARKAQAARYIELYTAEIETFKNDDNKNHFVSIDFSCTVDHYGLQYFIVGANIPA